MARTEIEPIRTKRDYEAALKEIERLRGAKAGTLEGAMIFAARKHAHPGASEAMPFFERAWRA